MSKVLLQYHYGKREPVTLSMPWQKEHLTWEHIGDAIEVDSRDAERLAATGWQSFRIVPRPLIPKKVEPVEVVEVPQVESPPPDAGTTKIICEFCGKLYNRQYYLDKHIEAKHGNDNSK